MYLDTKTRENDAKVGKTPADKLLARATFGGMDDNTAYDAETEQLDSIDTRCGTLCGFDAQTAHKQLIRANFRHGRGGDKLQIGGVGDRTGDPAQPEGAEDVNVVVITSLAKRSRWLWEPEWR